MSTNYTEQTWADGDATKPLSAARLTHIEDGIAAVDTAAIAAAAAAQATAISASQPVDSDLTAIAALTTTAYGRSLLTQANAAAAQSILGLGTAAAQASSAFDPAGAASTAQTAAQTYADGKLLKGNVVTKTANYTAAVGDVILADTTSATFTVTIPAASGGKGRIVVKWVKGTTAPTINLTGTDHVNTSTGVQTFTPVLLNQGYQLESDGASLWAVTADDLPLSLLDARYAAVGSFAPKLAFNPADYGTVDPTGAVSSRTAIQGAIDAAAAAGGGIVVLPVGTFLLSNTLNITASNVSLVGQGRATLLKIARAVASLHVISVQGTQATSIKGVAIHNLRWQGYGDDAGVTASSHGLYVRWCDWLKINDVWAHDCTFAALRIDDSEHAIINGVTVEQGTLGINGGWYGVELGNFTKGQGARGYSGYHVLTNVTTHVPEHSIAVYLCDDVTIDQAAATGGQNDYTYNWTASQRVVMTNFAIHTNGGGYLYLEWDQTLGTSRGCAAIKFAHGVCTGLVNAPDQYSGGNATPTPSDLLGVYMTNSPDTVLEDIHFDCSGQTLVTNPLHGVQADANSPRLRMLDCTILSPLGDGIKTAADGNTFHRVRVVSPRGATGTFAGFEITAGTNHILSACRVESGAGTGIFMGATNSLVSDCIITGGAGDGVKINGADNRVSGCISTSNTGWGFNFTASATRSRIQGNFAQTNTAGNYTTAGTSHYVDIASNKGMANELTAKSSTATFGQFDHIWVVDSSATARTITLPAANAVPPGREYVVKCKAGSANNVTLTAAGADTIDGTTTLVLTTGQVARVRSDGTSLWNAL